MSFFAEDGAAAARYVVDLARERGVATAIKGKSMVAEELDLNAELAKVGINAVETDLGEKLGTPKYDSIPDMAGEARTRLRDEFIRADMGITGANSWWPRPGPWYW